MSHDQNVGPRNRKGHGRDRFHEHGPLLLVAELRVVRLLRLGLFGLPYLVREVADDGRLELHVLLGEGGHAVPLDHRVGVFEAVAQAAGRGIDEELLVGDPRLPSRMFNCLARLTSMGVEAMTVWP